MSAFECLADIHTVAHACLLMSDSVEEVGDASRLLQLMHRLWQPP